MTGNERREKLIKILESSDVPVSGSKLAEELSVSRQIIVQDIALLRAGRADILSTSKGYQIMKEVGAEKPRRIFKVYHTNQDTEDELTSIVDMGGTVVDIFIQHKVYGTIKRPLGISSRREVASFMQDLRTGVSTPLLNITGGYHFHTVEAPSERVLREIEEMLEARGYLLESFPEGGLPDYDPKDYGDR